MVVDALRLLERLHGHVGWLAAAALLHPALLLRHPTRRAALAVALATASTLATFALGLAIYGAYRAEVKRALFREAPTLGWMFERKEHLAFGAALLSVAGAAAYVGARRAEPDAGAALRRGAQRAFALAFVLAAAAAALGTVVASTRSF